MNVAKYFWDLNAKALQETKKILKNPQHPKFIARIGVFLARCSRPKELFSLISKNEFVENWPKIKSYWLKITKESDFRDWWETIYEQILEETKHKTKRPKGKPSVLCLSVGKLIRETRIRNGLSQKDLAMRTGMKQPDISKIEEGKKNITLATLVRINNILGIKKIDL